MLRVLFFSSFVLILLSCTSQKIAGVQEVDAFFQVRVPGTIPMLAEGGAPDASYIDTIYVVYIQATGSLPLWEKAWKASQSFDIEVTQITDQSVPVGFHKSTCQEIRLGKKQGRQFYKLLLKKTGDNRQQPKVQRGELILQGRQQGREVFYPIQRITELQMPLHE